MKPLIAVAVSGGVDSLVAAHLLKSSGHKVLGVHFTTGFETRNSAPEPPADREARIRRMAERVCDAIRVFDLSKAFREQVVNPFTRAYLTGRTPNPCLLCNPAVKFGALLNAAAKDGAARLATGHYARVEQRPDDSPRLLKGVDPKKDQSYFLAFLPPESLSRAVFPLGGLTKQQVREIARENRLAPACPEESQDVCFIPDGDYAGFLEQCEGVSSAPGPIVDTSGREIGRHEGLHRFTVGQRRGINIPASEPYYVVRLEPEADRLVVGFKAAGYRKEFTVSGVNRLSPSLGGPAGVWVRIRYRHAAVPAQTFPDGPDRLRVVLDAPVSGVTPGQGAVFYQEDEVLGGGWIDP